MKVAIIGAGASGLVSAIYAAKTNSEVILIERNPNPGKKLLITGNGKCNYFNSDMTVSHYHSSNPENLKEIITKKNQEEILNLFENIGIVPKIKNGYFYPYSNKAVSVKDALVKECELLGVNIITDFKVEKIIKEDKFIIKDKNKEITADKVILALGSKAYPRTGSDGTGYKIASSFNHEIIKPLPALTPLIGKEKYFNLWSGVRHEAKLSLFENDKLIKEEQGIVQFTDYGISGICAFNLSTYITKGLDNNKKEQIKINFIPFIKATTQDIIDYLNNRSKKVTGRTIFELLEGILDYKLIKVILEKSNINTEKYLDELTKKEKYKLAENLYNFNLDIINTKSFENAQVCTGGVSLNEINPLTMESNLVKDLYIVGELLDVNGDCGGYNLAFAFISGMLAGKGVNNA